ncbi:MAG: DUF3037 domain-containing protein [Bauldia sp.]|nr:DUF3037 domain-containing protein [Bauldia sp.]
MSKTTAIPYTYIVLRYRHDSLAGEFANVGVVVHAPASGYLDARVRHTLGRISKMFPDLNGESLKVSVKNIEQAIKRLAASQGSDLFSRFKEVGAFVKSVLPDDDSSFIWGPVGAGLAANPAETLDKLYDRFVSRYDEKPRQHRDDASVWRPVRDRLAERKLADCLRAKTITSPLDHVEFEHAWKNGAWHCYQPVSFDLANEETIRDKARRWAGHLLALKDSAEPFRTYFFVGLPSDPSLKSACSAAMNILKLSPGKPEVKDETCIEDLVDQIEDDIRAHDRGVRK